MSFEIEYDLIKNFQSFEDIKFVYKSGFNILIADNETGKSIDKKIDKIMCFPNMYGRGNRKALIRKGKEFGYREIKLVEYDEPIIFKLYRTYQIYEWGAESWKQDFIPDKIAEALGWVYDKDFEFLLHIIDKDTPKIMTTAPARLTGAVFKKLFSNHELEQFMETMRVRSEDCINSRKEISKEIAVLEKLSSRIVYKSVEDLSMNIMLREEYLKEMNNNFNLYEVLMKLPELPEKVDKLPEYKNVKYDLYKLLCAIPEKPSSVELLPEYRNDYLAIYKALLSIPDKPKVIDILPKYTNNYLALYKSLLALPNKPKKVNKLKEYSNHYLALYKSLLNIPEKPKETKRIARYESEYFKLLKLMNYLADERKVYDGICPTCGQQLINNHEHKEV